MPLVTFDFNDFIQLLKQPLSKEKFLEKLPMIGADLDKVEDNTISIEFFPDRPDLLSVEGIVRASRAFFSYMTGLTTYPMNQSDIIIDVDPSVKKVRPVIRCAMVKNVTMSDELIASLMDLQEKLHFGIGRNRKKVAIGVHNYEPVQSPFIYRAVDPRSHQFVPLAKVDSMDLQEILEKHEKGIAYAHLLKDYDTYPLITDAYNNVLSFPPIINGILTEVTPYTKDLFIDVTGSDVKAVNVALNIVTTALAERGGTIYSTTIKDGNETIISPNLSPQKRTLTLDYVRKILGPKFSSDQIIQSLEKMGYNCEIKDDKTLSISIPAWRSDILHEIDLVEDVAIGYGFEQFNRKLPRVFTFGKHLPDQNLFDNLRMIMIGFGFNEVTTFTITNERDEYHKLGIESGKKVELKNPISEDYSCIRTTLLPSLLKILAENKHHPLPQKIFEVGIIVNETYKNIYHLGVLKTSAKSHFTECKSYVEGILRELGIQPYIITEKDHNAFVKGRCASVKVHEKEIGFFGELHPQTIINFELEHPIIAIEMNIEILKSIL